MIRLQEFSAFQGAAAHCKQNNPQPVNRKYRSISMTYFELLNEFLATHKNLGVSFRMTGPTQACAFNNLNESRVQSTACLTILRDDGSRSAVTTATRRRHSPNRCRSARI
jgi:hypothetical protein